MRSNLRVLGIDPGLTTLGFAVVDRVGGRLAAVSVGSVRTSRHHPLERRLAQIHAAVLAVVTKNRPDAAALERVFFNANVRTAISVGQASGVALAALGEADLEVAFYTPTEVKQSVCGFGGADKRQVGAMTAALLGLAVAPSPPDAADACALAICHLNRSGLARRVREALG